MKNLQFALINFVLNQGGVYQFPMIEFSKKDILRGKLVDPGWYRVKVTDVDEGKPSKDQKSTNYTVDMDVLYNADNGDKSFEGVPVSVMFNSKALGFMVGYAEALTGAKPEAGSRFRLEDSKGMELDVFIENKEWEGNIRNNINHKYRAPKAVDAE